MEYTFRDCTLNDVDFLFELKKQNFKYYVEKIWSWDDKEQRIRIEQDLKEHLEHKKIIMINNKDIRNICFSYNWRRGYDY